MKSININCPINGTGYGITSLNIVKQLGQHDLNISLFPIGNSIDVNSEADQKLILSYLNQGEKFSYNAPCLKIWHQYDLASKIGNGHYYTFPFFEIDKITEREKHHLNYSDYIFTASKWGKFILESNGVTKPIYVSPLGVDTEIFTTPNKIRMQQPNYVFLHIGKWEHRKSQDFLLKAFEAAFNTNDEVELWLVPFNPFLKEEEHNYWLKLVEECKLKDKIKLFNRFPTQYHLAELISNSDCGVYLSRAEGWNNEVVETMALNKPVIVTNYSAHTEYCNDKNSYLVDVSSTEPANDGKWFNGYGNWAKLGHEELEQTVHYMKYVYSNRIDSNPEGLKTANNYSWTRTAQIIHNTLLNNGSYYANTKAKSKRR